MTVLVGLAPGKEAETEITGKSTCGNGDTGSKKKLITPASATPNVTKVVASSIVIFNISIVKSHLHFQTVLLLDLFDNTIKTIPVLWL